MSINKNTKIKDNPSYSLGVYSSILEQVHIFNKDVDKKYIPDFTWRFLILHSEQSCQPNIVSPLPNDFTSCHPIFTNKTFIDINYDRSLICDKVFNRIINTIRKIQWKSEILEEVSRYEGLLSNALGMTVRSWTAPHEKNIKRSYNKQTYLNLLNSVTADNSITTVMLSVDNHDLYPDYKNELKLFNVFVYTPPDHFTELQYVCVKLLLLSKCKYLIGNRISTFTEMSFWLSECNQIVFPL